MRAAYLPVDGEPVDLARCNPSQAWAAGEIVSTAADLNRFYAAVLGGELLAKAEQEAMLTVVPTDETFGYGLGIERRRLPDGQVLWGHTGGFFGYLTLSYHSADLSRQLTLSYTGTGARRRRPTRSWPVSSTDANGLSSAAGSVRRPCGPGP